MAAENRDFVSKCSYFEIYKEDIFDLLDPRDKKMTLRENKSGVFI
jgi:hypothetical protein